jgi:hypothetical protein
VGKIPTTYAGIGSQKKYVICEIAVTAVYRENVRI